MKDQRNADDDGCQLPSPPLAPPEAAPKRNQENPRKHQQSAAAVMHFQWQPFGQGTGMKMMLDAQSIKNIKRAAQHDKSGNEAMNEMGTNRGGHGISVLRLTGERSKPRKGAVER